MREHMGLYRGKQRESGAWVEGWLVVNRAAIEPEEPEMTFCYILAYGNNSYVTWYPVDPDTVGECTGLRDKNGELIFEGDILEGYDFDAEDGFGVVEWDDGAWEVISEGNWLGTFHENYNGYEFEIISNVHDNPELLKGGEGDEKN